MPRKTQALDVPITILKTGVLVFTGLSMATGCTTFAKHEPSVDRVAKQYRVCAAAIAIIKARKIDSLVTSEGCEGETPINANGVYQAASLSKPLFAYAVIKLAEQGKLDLDTPLTTYLPTGYRRQFNPFKAEDPAKVQVVLDPRLERTTARMVLNHTSGLPNWAGATLDFDFEPGTQWQYSGEGYVLLQRVVEAITGQPLNRYMNEQVFSGIGMTDSGYVWQPQFESHYVHAAAADGTIIKSRPFLSPVAAATLYTSAKDYARFLVALLNDQKALGQITDSAVAVDAKLNVSWGLGWGIEHYRRGDGRDYVRDYVIWQWGNNPGYKAFAMASVSSGDGFVLLTNSDSGLALAEPIANKVLPGPHPLFRFYMLRSGLAHVLCKEWDTCW